MTTTVTVKVPQDASYEAHVVTLDQVTDAPPQTLRTIVSAGQERTFHAHSTRTIEVSEQPIDASEVGPAS